MANFMFVTTMGGVSWGGSEELWAGAAMRLLKAGHQVSAHVFQWKPDPSQISELERQGARVHRRRRWLRLPFRIAYPVIGLPTSEKPFTWRNRKRPELVVVSQGHTLDGVNVMLECARRNWPYAAIVQASGEALWPSDAQATAARSAYSKARRTYFVSENNRRMLSDQIADRIENAEVISNPFTVRHLPTLDAVPPTDALKLACVARLDPVAKGQDVLLHVLALEKWRRRRVEVNFFGQGRCEATVRRLAQQLVLSSAQFCGHVNDIEAIWAAHHALILPSRMEGTPLALIEAMLCSRTAIVTDVGGNTELIENGITGFVAKAPTVELLDEALERAWQRRSELAAMGQAARDRIVKLIPSDPIGDFTERLLRLV